MNVYQHVAFKQEVRIDEILEKDLLRSQFELSGLFTPDNLIVEEIFTNDTFDFLREPRNTTLDSAENVSITGKKILLQESVALIIKRITATMNVAGSHYFPLAYEESSEAQRKGYIEALGIWVKNKFDSRLLSDLIGAQSIRSDMRRDGTVVPYVAKDLPADSGRPIISQVVNLTGAPTANQGKSLLEELRSAVKVSSIPKQDMKLLNSPIYVLLPISALEAYHTALQVFGAKSISMVNNIFSYAEFTFVGFPTSLFPIVTAYTALILPRDAVKFLIQIRKTQGEIMGKPNPDDVFVTPFIIHTETQQSVNDNDVSRGDLIHLSKMGCALRYRPEFIQQWNIATTLIP
jgi:hypothetical protein